MFRVFFVLAVLTCAACGFPEEVSKVDVEVPGVGTLHEVAWSNGQVGAELVVSNSFRHRQEWDEARIRFSLIKKAGAWQLQSVFFNPAGMVSPRLFVERMTKDEKELWTKRLNTVLEAGKWFGAGSS